MHLKICDGVQNYWDFMSKTTNLLSQPVSTTLLKAIYGNQCEYTQKTPIAVIGIPRPLLQKQQGSFHADFSMC